MNRKSFDEADDGTDVMVGYDDEPDVAEKRVLIDSVFFACDPASTGSVAVSDVITYLRDTLHLKVMPESLEKLQKFLDVFEMNHPLDLRQYRTGMSLWMKSLGVDISYRDDEVCNSAEELASHSYAFTRDDLQLDGNIRNQLENNENNNNNNNNSLYYLRVEPIGAESTLETSNCCSEVDVMEIQARLTAAELEKSRLADALLAEKKIKLELSEKTDDLNSQLSLQKQLLFESQKSCQVVNDRMTEIRNENEDLKSAAVIADELYQKVLAEKGMLEMDLNRAKQDKNHLVQQMAELQSDIDASAENTEQLKASFKEEMELQKREITSVFECQISEMSHQIQELTNERSQLVDSLESARKEKIDLETQLADMALTLNCDESVKLADAMSSDPESDDESVPLHLISRSPHTPRSLCFELSSSIVQSPVLPSPLCDKELEDLIFRVGRRQTDDLDTSHSAADDEVGGDRQLPSWTSSAILTNKSCGVLRALVHRELDEMMRLASATDGRELYEAAVERFIDKLLTIVRARNDFEKKNCKQRMLLLKWKDFSDAERARYHESQNKLNADIEGLENCIRDYIDQLQFERAKSDQLETIIKHLEEAAGRVERVDVACSTSVLDDGTEEMWTVLGYDADTAGEQREFVKPSVGRCSRCLVETRSSENAGVDSGTTLVESGSNERCIAADLVDVACGSDAPAARLIDVSCGPDAAVVVDAPDARCGVTETSDDNVQPKDQSDRHTVDLLAFLAFLLALCYIMRYTVCILANLS